VATPRGIVGRDEELGSLDAWLDEVGGGPSALLLEGAAGIGKSTLWSAGVERARVRGVRVLVSRPAEAERELAHTCLGDLFEDELERVLPALSPPQRRALEVALLVEDAAEASDARTLGVAVRSALGQLVEEGPVVLAVDDVQWLDASSASAVGFALRRMRGQAVHLLLARRVGEGAPRSGLESALESSDVETLPIGPLSLGAVHSLLQSRLGRMYPRPTLLRVHEVSAGNPFYALELARALGPDVDATQPLRVPESLEELLVARLSGLPQRTRTALLLAAAVGRPTDELLAAAGATRDELEPAHATHVVERTDETIRFTHPLLASVLYQGASADERRRTHACVAALVEDPLDRARHLALATENPDPTVAATLEEASGIATSRGAPIMAAELGEHALRLTPPDAHDERHRRAIAAARAHFEAGAAARARAIAGDLLDRAPTAESRAEALVLLAELSESLDRIMALLAEALDEAAALPALRAVIHRRLARIGRLTNGLSWAEEHARTSLELAEALNDDDLRAHALAVLAVLRFDLGDPEAPRLTERAYAAAVASSDFALQKEATRSRTHVLVWSVETEQARDLIARTHREWSDRDELASAEALWYGALVELRAGRWSLAARYAEHSREVGAQYGIEIPQHFFPIALVAAHLGELEHAREVTQEWAEVAGKQAPLLAGPAAVLGLVDVWAGDAAPAAASFAIAEEKATKLGWREPNMRWWRADYAEALLELGGVNEAVRLLDAWEADAVRVSRDWVLAQVTRCRGLVAAAEGHVERSISLLEHAVARHRAVGDPFGHARALLALGIVRRRARQRRAAREALEAALAGFEELGAVTWVGRARAQLGRIGGRTRVDGLTVAERRVADLVAQGKTNREVAAALFLGERTVASHLTHIYAKLGVRSRTELARKLR
jgi:DNA-binding CsgD family transcriptional regulator